ncbi:MAG: Septum formation initiator [Parcubacteria group bacterium ADurb.Bin305]|jgi:cell division protein FtsB|nr:septum formation initiator family protein [Candidatus Paceibacterota bacterium]OQA43394.1 MAG: Septum formation initiator [Parcubacteria group bacterium ADurb.Bin305]
MRHEHLDTRSARSVLVAVIVGGLSLIFIVQLYKDYTNYRLLKQEVESLTKKHNQIQAEINQLKILEMEGQNEESLEKQARLMFGFKKAGEEVVMVVPPQNESQEVPVISTTYNTSSNTNHPVKHWWSNLIKTFNNFIVSLIGF